MTLLPHRHRSGSYSRSDRSHPAAWCPAHRSWSIPAVRSKREDRTCAARWIHHEEGGGQTSAARPCKNNDTAAAPQILTCFCLDFISPSCCLTCFSVTLQCKAPWDSCCCDLVLNWMCCGHNDILFREMPLGCLTWCFSDILLTSLIICEWYHSDITAMLSVSRLGWGSFEKMSVRAWMCSWIMIFVSSHIHVVL